MCHNENNLFMLVFVKKFDSNLTKETVLGSSRQDQGGRVAWGSPNCLASITHGGRENVRGPSFNRKVEKLGTPLHVTS